MARKIGVICKNCGQRIPVEDEYVPGIRAVPLAISLYQPGTGGRPDSASRVWRKSLNCENPDCLRTHNYTGGDLVLYND